MISTRITSPYGEKGVPDESMVHTKIGIWTVRNFTNYLDIRV